MAVETATLITNAIFVAILLIINRILVVTLKRIEKRRIGSHRAIAGARIIIRLILVLFIAVAVISSFDLEKSTVLSISSVSGIIIGFASTEIVNQIISGIILITSHPFGVHDMVKIGNAEGIVVEINLNYTKVKQFDNTVIKIPNKQLINSEILNFTQKIDPKMMLTAEEVHEVKNSKDQGELSESEKSIFNMFKMQKVTASARELFKEFIDFGKLIEVTRYIFEIEVEYSHTPKSVMDDLNLICRNYTSIYGFQPSFSIIGLGYRAKIQFKLLSTSAQTIMNQQNNFVYDIASVIYGEEGES